MKWYKADLHIHTVLSPCGSLEMSPKAVIKKAKEESLDIIAITDHNSMLNCPAYSYFAKKENLLFINGVEIQTSEEIHIIALFPNWKLAKQFDVILSKSLLQIPNDSEFFGDQVVIDKDENIIKMYETALINSSTWSYEETIEKIKLFNGVYFPAHINAGNYSVLSQLGFIPNSPELYATEIILRENIENFLISNPNLNGLNLLTNSDAHYLKDIANAFSYFYLDRLTIKNLFSLITKKDIKSKKYIKNGRKDVSNL
jgi:PHP family Zn ribbon phosphoesterase